MQRFHTDNKIEAVDAISLSDRLISHIMMAPPLLTMSNRSLLPG